jgi:hypothetical protein
MVDEKRACSWRIQVFCFTLLSMRIVLIPIALFAVSTLAACVDSQRLRSNLGGPAAAYDVEKDASKQTLASKILGAIAFERVTARKADASRLNEFH